MNQEARKKYEEELKIDMERIQKEIEMNPDLVDIVPAEDAYENIWKGIRENEAKAAEEKELIRLGKIYRRKRKNHKYLVLAAVLVFVMALGVTSMGGAEKIFETFRIMTMGKEKVQINSNENVDVVDYVNEESVYEEIEEKFGFLPVRLNHLPERIVYQEAIIGEAIQKINLIYGHEDKADIIYIIRPNFREGSFGTDIEDTKLQEYQLVVNDVEMEIKQYRIEESGEDKWAVEFVYQDVQYLLRMMRMEQEEVEMILRNLYFP